MKTNLFKKLNLPEIFKNGHIDISGYDYLGEGSYKICFTNNEWVIKFYYDKKVFQQEEKLYNQLLSSAARPLMPLTYFIENEEIYSIPVESDLFSFVCDHFGKDLVLDNEMFSKGCYVKSEQFSPCGIAIQEYCNVVVDEEDGSTPEQHKRDIDSLNEIYEEEFFCEFECDSFNWLISIENHYPILFKPILYTLLKFNIKDLSNDNIGYRENGEPVIIDWISY